MQTKDWPYSDPLHSDFLGVYSEEHLFDLYECKVQDPIITHGFIDRVHHKVYHGTQAECETQMLRSMAKYARENSDEQEAV